jgi:hypothetical protein
MLDEIERHSGLKQFIQSKADAFEERGVGAALRSRSESTETCA